MTYEPKNWYWYVGGDETRAYSSAVGNYVLANDASFQAWLALGNTPTSIASAFDLGGGALAPYLLRPIDAAVLDGYKDALADYIVIGVVFKILFNHENRLRAIERNLSLNGSPPNLTAAQAKAAVKALM